MPNQQQQQQQEQRQEQQQQQQRQRQQRHKQRHRPWEQQVVLVFATTALAILSGWGGTTIGSVTAAGVGVVVHDDDGGKMLLSSTTPRTSAGTALDGSDELVCSRSASLNAENSLLVEFPFESGLRLSPPGVNDLCGGKVSCCPVDIQQRMLRHAPQAMRQKLRFLDEYRDQLMSLDQTLRDEYALALSESREYTLRTLHEDLRFVRHNDSVDVFYRKLQLYLVVPPTSGSAAGAAAANAGIEREISAGGGAGGGGIGISAGSVGVGGSSSSNSPSLSSGGGSGGFSSSGSAGGGGGGGGGGGAHYIESAVQQLFSDLFISVFHQMANPRLRDFSDDYATCLRRQTSSLQPFGEYPQRLAAYFAKSFQAAHLLMRSARTLAEVLRTAADMNVTNHGDCRKATANLFYCPTCRGLSELKPCSSLCLNVMRGCLAPLSDLDAPWSHLVDKTIVLLRKSQETNYQVEHALLIISRRLIDAVQYAMDNGIEVVKRVRANCGDPHGPAVAAVGGGSSQPKQPSAIRRSSSPTSLLTGSSKALQELMERLQRKLVEIRDRFGTLSEHLCPALGNSECWTGSEMGTYRKSTAGRGVQAQRLNPEVGFNEHQTPNYVPLVEHSLQMKLMATQLMQAGVMRIRPENDNYQGIETRQQNQQDGDTEGSGAFDGSGDSDGSGSGSTPDDDTEAEREPDTVTVTRSKFNSSMATAAPPTGKESSGSSARPHRTSVEAAIMALLSFAVTLAARNAQG